MPTTVIQPQQPRRIGPAFAIVLIGAFLVMVVVLATIVDRRQAKQTGPVLADNGTDTGWINRMVPKPTPAPEPFHPMPAPMPTVAPFHPPQVATFQQPHVAPTISEEERERLRRYHAALQSDIGIKTNHQTLETPRVLASNDPATSQPTSVKPAPPHTVTPWTMISAVLETSIQSDHASDVLARVSQPVKDATLTEVLIPAGALLHGWQDGRNQVLQNDHSILVRWDQIEYPNGGTVNLPQMPAMGPEGFAGIDGDVNHHYAQVWGPALLISAITAGVSLAQHPTYGGYQGYSPEQQAFGSGAEVLGGRAIGQLGSEMNVRPTITVPAGSTFRVLVTRNLTFDGPYQGVAQ